MPNFNNYGGYSPQYYQPAGYNQTAYQPMNQYNQPQQMVVQQNPQLSGRIVNDVADIRPYETPTTGTPAVFPKADGSAIYLTAMDNTGRIITREYIPKDIPVETSQSSDLDMIKAEIAEIKSMLSSLVN